jgi:hypothetical protein
MERPKVNDTLLSGIKSLSITLEPVTEPCSDSVKIGGSGPFTKLPLKLLPEVVLIIFDNLDALTSTCLGLTCKYLYKIHRKFYGSVCLAAPIEGTRQIL